MPPACETRAGAGPCSGSRGDSITTASGHPFWETASAVCVGLGLWTGWQLWSGRLPAARGHSQTTPSSAASSAPGRQATGLALLGAGPHAPMSLCAQMPPSTAGPAPASQAAPTQSALEQPRAARQAPSFLSTLFRAPLFPSCPRMSRVDLRNYLSASTTCRGRRADEGAAWWVGGRAFSRELSRPGCQPRCLAPVSPSSTWSLHVRKQARLGGEGPSFPGLGLGGLVRRLLRAGSPA